MNYTLQRKYRSLERRREPKKMPKLPKLPEKVFYRILDDGSGDDQSRSKKHVKFQLLGEEDEDAKTGVLCSDFSPVPARYCASSVHRTRTRLIPCTWISFMQWTFTCCPKYYMFSRLTLTVFENYWKIDKRDVNLFLRFSLNWSSREAYDGRNVNWMSCYSSPESLWCCYW